MAIAWSLCSLLTPGASVVFAAQETALERSGVRYPDGFDVNTVGEVRGRAAGFQVPDQGPVTFTLSAKKETYTVFASPRWYWDDLGIPVQEGLELRVLGSKTLGMDGNLYVVAQELTVVSSGKSYTLRSLDGSPLWRGPRIGAGGPGRAGDQPFRGGTGGGGRGRR
jgi:hypothetical protein